MKTIKTNAVDEGFVVDIRQSMNKLPSFLQPFLTWLTGKPLKGQKPLLPRSNASHLVTAYLALFSGIALSITSTFFGSWFLLLLPAGWVLTVSGARKLVTTINHYCVHQDFLPAAMRKKYSWLHAHIADINTGILFLQSYRDYKKEHYEHHDGKIVASIVDPDMAFMWQLGFKAGMTKKQLVRTYLFNLLVPFSKLHRLFFVSRLKTTLCRGNATRVVAQVMVIASMIMLVWLTSVPAVLAGWVLPLTYLYHIASLMQFSSEHLWLTGVQADGMLDTSNHKGLINRSKRITSARFCGEATPAYTANTRKRYLAWAGWGLKMLFLHLPVRLFVLPGDLVVHDWHHRCGFGADWANAFYSRAEMVANLKEGEAPLTEVWGLYNAIDLVFENFSKMAPINPAQMEFEADAVLGM